MRARDRFERSEHCITMEGFDGEFYIFNEENRRFVETEEMGAYAFSLVNGERRFNDIVEAVSNRFAGTNVGYEEISREITETFQLAMRIGAVKKKLFPW